MICDDNVESIVHDAEAALVLRNYKRARSLALEGIKSALPRRGEEKSLQQEERDSVLLTTSAVSFEEHDNSSKSCVFRIGHAFIFAEDRAAVVLLQSSYEISKIQGTLHDATIVPVKSFANSKHSDVLLFLDRYAVDSCRNFAVVPLEVAVVFIGYCHALGHTHAAVTLTLDILGSLLSLEYNNTTTTGDDAEISTNVNDLLWFLLTEILPFAVNPNDVTQVLHHIFKQHPRLSSFKMVLTSKPNEASVARVLDELNNWRLADAPPSTHFVVKECQAFLLPLAPKHTEPREKKCSTNADGQISELDWRRRYTLEVSKRLRQSFTQLYHFVIIALRQQVTELYWNSDDRWANRGKAALTVFLLLMAWKKQRSIRKHIIVLVATSLGPFREILDAFMLFPKK
jgi:hypothetical protein